MKQIKKNLGKVRTKAAGFFAKCSAAQHLLNQHAKMGLWAKQRFLESARNRSKLSFNFTDTSTT